jgi:hypothetical protein
MVYESRKKTSQKDYTRAVSRNSTVKSVYRTVRMTIPILDVEFMDEALAHAFRDRFQAVAARHSSGP